MKQRLVLAFSFLAVAACTPAPPDDGGSQGTGGNKPSGTGGSAPSGTGGSAPSGTGGSAPSGTGGSVSPGTGGSVSPGTGGSVSPGTGGSSGTGGSPSQPDAGTETGPPPAGGMWGELDGAFLDVKCATMRSGGFCRPEGMGVKNVMIKFGGEAGKMYDVTLKVWAITEGITFRGGELKPPAFYIGGESGTANYGPCGFEIGAQKYHINYHAQGGRDTTRKFEYTAPPIKIPGGSMITLFCRDTNNHLTMNSATGKHSIENPPPELAAKIGMQPVEGHFFYLKVESATASP